MHELSLCQHVIDILVQQSSVQNYHRVKKIYFEIGALANIEKSAFLFSFDIAAQNTIAEGAELELMDVPGSAVCRDCGQTVSIQQWFNHCSVCGSDQLTIESGEEFRIKTLKVE